jgi:hypothetical protein
MAVKIILPEPEPKVPELSAVELYTGKLPAKFHCNVAILSARFVAILGHEFPLFSCEPPAGMKNIVRALCKTMSMDRLLDLQGLFSIVRP